MKILRITAAMLVTAVFLTVLCACGQDRSGYMTNNCKKDGVKEFIAQYPELKEYGFTEKTCYNITPDDFGPIALYKSSETAYTVAVYPGYSYTFIDTSSAPGLISASLCDFDGNGVTDIIYTYSSETEKKYGIGVYSGVTGVSSPVIQSDGSLCPYVVKQRSNDASLPDVYSILAVTVEAFDNNPADLGCVAVADIGTVTARDGAPYFSMDSGESVEVVGYSEEGIKKVIITSVPSSSEHDKTVEDAEEIKQISDFVKGIKTKDEAEPDASKTTFIIAFVYDENKVCYAYYNAGGYFKFHGEKWRETDGETVFRF